MAVPRPLHRLLGYITGVPEKTIVSLKEIQAETAARYSESARQLETAFSELDAALTRVGKNVKPH